MNDARLNSLNLISRAKSFISISISTIHIQDVQENQMTYSLFNLYTKWVLSAKKKNLHEIAIWAHTCIIPCGSDVYSVPISHRVVPYGIRVLTGSLWAPRRTIGWETIFVNKIIIPSRLQQLFCNRYLRLNHTVTSHKLNALF